MKANIVVFHGPTHTTQSSPKLNSTSLRAMVSMEQPKYAPILSNRQYLLKNFDLMVKTHLSIT
jgi:hypothetical protein